jgi:magnesium chelatase subunit D
MNSAWDDSLWALAALATDPNALKGIWLKTSHGPVTQEWLHWLHALRNDCTKLPCNVDTERLLGGMDLAMTLQSGKPVKQLGLLAQSNDRLLLCPMADRMSESSCSILAQALDTKRVSSHFSHETDCTKFGLIAIDESRDDERGLTLALREQLAIWLDLNHTNPKDTASDETLEMLERVEKKLTTDRLSFERDINAISIKDQDIKDLCELAIGFSINSLRAPWYAIRLASTLAVLRGSDRVESQDLGRAARLVLTPRATSLPNQSETDDALGQSTSNTPPPSQPNDPLEPDAQDNKDDHSLEDRSDDAHQSPPEPDQHEQTVDQETREKSVQAMETSVLEAALATLPAGLLNQLAQGQSKSKNASAGRVGELQKSSHKGRPLSPLKGQPSNGSRLHVLATLRHAAPRQKIRELNSVQDASNEKVPSAGKKRIKILSEDFHVQRFAKKSESCIVFCIDASGSAALERLAEAKGAVELLLKDSYARRDHICVIGFRDRQALLHLPITRSLLRAKRELQSLPGGGGTPLASALKLCAETALQARHHGMMPTLVILSDGRANITLQGEGSRPTAKMQALNWARQWNALKIQSIWLDTSARADQQAQEIAFAMGAKYVPLPHANSQHMAKTVQRLKDVQN